MLSLRAVLSRLRRESPRFWRPQTVAIAFGLWFAFAAFWGLGALPAAGHLGGGQAGAALMGENIVRWKTLYPLWTWYSTTKPGLDQAYCHHPFGVHWLSALAIALFGHRDFAVALPAVLMSTATPYLFYRVASLERADTFETNETRGWGVACGVVAAAAFTVVPIAVAFSSYHNLEVMAIFGLMLFFLGHAEYTRNAQPKYLVLALAGAVVSVCSDWIAYVGLGAVLGYDLIRLWVLPGKVDGTRLLRANAKVWILTATLAVLSLVMWIALFQNAGKMDDWLGSAQQRGSGEVGGIRTSLPRVLAARKAWIDTSFTPLAIALGKLSLLFVVVRPLVRRTAHEIYPLAMFLVAALQYVGFRQGAEVHYFWPHYFAAFYALGLAAMLRTLLDLRARVPLLARSRILAVPWFERITLGLFLVPSLIMVPDAWRMRTYAWETGGRFNEHGTHVRSERFYFQVLREKAKVALGSKLQLHPNTGWGGWEAVWAIHGQGEVSASPSRQPSAPFWAARGDTLGPADQKTLAHQPGMTLYGSVWLNDIKRAYPLTAMRVVEREPSLWERWWSHPTELAYDLSETPDPFATWEARTHYGLDAELPTQAPQTIEDIRIAHNIAMAGNDMQRASELRAQIMKRLVPNSGAAFSEGVALLGIETITSGAVPRLVAWFEGAPTQGDAVFNVYSSVKKSSPWSLIPADETTCGVGQTFAIPTPLWHKGFLYKMSIPLHHRPGTERYWSTWGIRSGPHLKRLDGKPETELATVW